MLNKLIEFFFPLTHNPNDFILKNKATWFSNKYRYILYSGNKGKSFKKINSARQPLFTHGDTILSYNWSYEPMTFNAETTSFNQYKQQFKNLSDVLTFQTNEAQKYLKGTSDVKKVRQQYMENFKNNIS